VAGGLVTMNTVNAAAPETEPARLVHALAAQLLARGWMLATAESCTGGLIAAACTDLAGSSTWFERGFVTYSNAAKAQMLGVDAALIAQRGAVSEPVARAMAQGALQHAHAQVALAVTGVAGPGGGSADKPVGTVWFAWALPAQTSDAGASDANADFAGRAKSPPPDTMLHSEVMHFEGDRATVRQATLHHSLRRLLELLAPPQAGSTAA
jgi:nicotinamide-nucleotide amidase